MQIHKVRKNESLDDISFIYALQKEKIININNLKGEVKENNLIIIPTNKKVCFTRNEEEKKYIEGSFSVYEKAAFENNISRYFIKDKEKKQIDIYSFIDERNGVNAFILADGIASYLTHLVSGYYISPNNAYNHSYPLKACYLNNLIPCIIIKLNLNLTNNLDSFFSELLENSYKEIIVFYKDINEENINFLKNLKDKCKKNNINLLIFINENELASLNKDYVIFFDKVIFLTKSLAKKSYKIFNENKLIIALNLEDNNIIDFYTNLELFDKINPKGLYIINNNFTYYQSYNLINNFFLVK